MNQSFWTLRRRRLLPTELAPSRPCPTSEKRKGKKKIKNKRYKAITNTKREKKIRRCYFQFLISYSLHLFKEQYRAVEGKQDRQTLAVVLTHVYFPPLLCLLGDISLNILTSYSISKILWYNKNKFYHSWRGLSCRRSHPFVLSSHPLHSILVPYSIPKVFALCMIQRDEWVYEQKKTLPIWQPFLAWIWEKYYRGKSESQILGWSLWSLHVTKPEEAPLFLAPPLTVLRVLRMIHLIHLPTPLQFFSHSKTGLIGNCSFKWSLYLSFAICVDLWWFQQRDGYSNVLDWAWSLN